MPAHPDVASVTAEVTGQVTEQVLTVLRVCSTPQKSADLQKLLGLKHRETFQRNYLDPLLAKGWIARTIPEKPKSRMQRYLTTDAGQHLVKQTDSKQ